MDKTENLIIVGDIHTRLKQPYFLSKQAFFDWLLDNPDYNNENNSILLLGDLADTPKLDGLLNEYLIDVVLNRMKFKRIIILTGNHDSRRREGNYLKSLAPLPGVEIIEKLTELEIGNLSILALPHYVTKKKGDIPMRQYYEGLAEDQELAHDYDFICGHFPDETQIEFAKGINLSGLSGKRIMGDIHTPSENYLGTPVINRLDEKGKDSRIAVVDLQTKEYRYDDVPKFLDFYDLDYENPDKNIGFETPYKLFIMENAPSREAAVELCKDMGGWLHKYSTVSEDKIIDSSDLESFNKDQKDFIKTSVVEYAKHASIPKGTLNKLKTVMQVEEEIAV